MADRRLAGLAVVTAVATWLLVVVGGVVRVTGSGMGCPDWPYCFGAVMPPGHLAAEQHLPAWIEMAHRYAAGAVALLVVATAVLAWRRRAAGAPWRLAAAAVAVTVVQIFLGAVTVWQGNAPWTVQAHLLAALLLVAFSTAAALVALGPTVPVRLDGRAWTLLSTTLALAMVGSVVQTTGGGWSCPDFPLCRGQLWPAALGLPAQVHMLHRLLVLVVAAALIWVAVPAWRQGSASSRRWAAAAGTLFLAQAAVGLAQVLLVMPDVLRGAHLALAAAFWAALIGLVVRRGQAAVAVDSHVTGAAAMTPALKSS